MRGLAQYEKRKYFYDLFRRLKADIILMQETHSSQNLVKNWHVEWPGTWVSSHGSTNARGVCTLFSRSISDKISDLKSIPDEHGRSLICHFQLENKSFSIANIYGHNSDTPSLFQDTAEQIKMQPSEAIIIGGDFNFVIDSSIDSRNRIESHRNTKATFNQICEELNLVDVWRNRNPDKSEFTWRKLKTRTFSRLDMFFVDVGSVLATEHSTIESALKTDHSCIMLTLNLNDYQRGPGTWKLNNLLLANENYKQGVKKTIIKAKNNASNLPSDEKWDFIKSEIIDFSQKFSKQVSKQDQEHIRHLNKSLKVLHYDILANNNESKTNQIIEAIKCIELEIESKEDLRIKSQIFRTKLRNFNDFEKCTKSFFNLEKRNYFSKNMKAVKNKDGHIIKEQHKILQEQQRFYRDLYTSNDKTIFNLTPKTDETLVTKEQYITLDQPISTEELHKALLSMKDNKCPGSDGLGKEFYVTFFDDLKESLVELYSHCYKIGKLNYSARTGIISLIPKKDKNLLDLGAWRALTLLNLDFKILSKTMALRLQEILPTIISTEQNGFMKNRDISYNIRRTFEVMEFTDRQKYPGLIMTIDFYKCFDTIEHEAIRGALNYFGFPPSFIKWVNLFFSDLIIYNQNYGFLSEPFNKTRGINQGCCISPFCFLLCREILARRIKDNKKIRGIPFNKDITALLSQFADDTTLFLTYDKECLENVIEEFATIETHTGLTVNYNKTLIYRIGSLSKSEAKIYTKKEFVWTNSSFNLLGIDIAQTNCTTLNFNKTIEKMEVTMEKWDKRQLSIMGKVLIVNTLCESLFVYKLNVLRDINPVLIKKVDNAVSRFLWKGKRAKIAKSTLIRSKECGGIRLFSLENKQKAIKANWIERLKIDTFFRNIFFKHIIIPDKSWFHSINLHQNDSRNYYVFDSFWSEAFTHWCEITFTAPQTFQEILCQPLWYNSNIRINDKPIYFPKLADQGIICMADLYKPNNNSNECLYSLEELREIFNVNIPWLTYLSIKKAIPKIWLALIKGPSENVQPPNGDHIMKDKQVKIFYKTLINKDDHLSKYAQRWESENLVINDLEKYKQCFSNLYKMSDNIKLRDFQYRLLLCKIPCNKQTKMWRLSESEYCTHKCNEVEDIFHTLYSCKYSKRIWLFIQNIIPNIKILPLNEEKIVLNTIHQNVRHIVNNIVLLTKQYLYRHRCQSKLPSINGIKKEINLLYNIEKYNATKNRKVKSFYARWSPLSIYNVKK